MNRGYGTYGGYGRFAPEEETIRTVVHTPRVLPSAGVTSRAFVAAAEDGTVDATSPLGPGTEPFPTPAGGIDTEAVYYAFPEEKKKKGRRGPPPQPAAEPNPYLIGGLLLTALVGVGVFAFTRRGRRRRLL